MVVLVDTQAAAGVTVTQLADYIAMISFAKPDLEADLGKTESILQLFAVEPANRPSGLTEWDQAFLRGLYRISYTPKQQRTAIATGWSGSSRPPNPACANPKRVRVSCAPRDHPQPRVFGFSGGTWRSLVAHLHGVQGVPSSNLGVPTNLLQRPCATIVHTCARSHACWHS